MANEIEKVNTIAITDIEKVNGKTDDNIEKLNALEFAGVSIPGWAGTRAVLFGGRGTASGTDVSTDWILYKTIGSGSNTQEFGQMNTHRDTAKGTGSNGTKAIMGGGYSDPGSGSTTYGVNDMDHVTVASTGDAGDFGNLAEASGDGGYDGGSNGTLLFFHGGYTGSQSANMEQTNIASGSQGNDAGDLEAASNSHAVSNGDSKCLIMGGYVGSGTPLTTVSKHSFHTSNNATSYGGTSGGIYTAGTACATDRVVVAGGFVGSWSRVNEIRYFAVASEGDSTDKGDLHDNIVKISGWSDGTTGEFGGGEEDSGYGVAQNRINKITIMSGTTVTDEADLTHRDFVASANNDDGGAHRISSTSGT